MEALEALGSLDHRSVLDVGTGTGILSLAALLLGVRKAVAFDIDGDAARTCYRNAALNRVSERLKVYQGTLEALNPTLGFDLILANIHGDIILKEAHRLAGHTREEGYLVLSGLDYTDNKAVKLAMGGLGMEEVSVLFLEEFVTQVWRRPPGRD
jgi:ribosomal protein L11 methyltransferase